jgi:hypothetical protein
VRLQRSFAMNRLNRSFPRSSASAEGVSILDGMTQISPTAEALPVAEGGTRFPTLSVADNPSPADYVAWLKQLIQAIEVWGEPEPDDAVQYGQNVRCAGKIAAFLGFADLYQESLTVAEIVPRHVFGAEVPACSQDEAYLFFGTCISRALTTVAGASPNDLPTDKELQSARGATSAAKPMQPAHADALRWAAEARKYHGDKASAGILFIWARNNKHKFEWKLPNRLDTFATYLRRGERYQERRERG